MSLRLNDIEDALDGQLVELHRAGDENAFDQLYRRHSARLYRFVRMRVRQPEHCEDMVQETFARALASLDNLRDPSRFYPWLTVIARHLTVEHHRSAAKLCLLADIEGEAVMEAPDSRLMREADEQEVEEALGRVRGRHRAILEMREREELSYEDIAARLGTPATTVPPLLFRARLALRREYFHMIDENPKVLGVIPALAAAWRRLRTRAGQYMGWLPDANAWCASATCIAVGVGSLFFPSGAVELTPTRETSHDTMTSQESTTLPLLNAQAANGQGIDDEARHSPRASATPPPTRSVRGVAEISIDNSERANWGRERARDMPIYHEVGPAWFSADPEQFRRDMESTLAGDPEWMEGS